MGAYVIKCTHKKSGWYSNARQVDVCVTEKCSYPGRFLLDQAVVYN